MARLQTAPTENDCSPQFKHGEGQTLAIRFLIDVLLITRANNRFNSTPHIKIADDFHLPRLTCSDDIFKHLVDDMLMKDADIPIGQQILLQRFEFNAVPLWHVGNP